MRTLLCASLIFLFATTASAQFAKNPALRAGNKPADADPPKAAGNPADQPALPADPLADAAGGGAPNTLFAALDIDGDGVVSKVELRRAMASLKKLDADNDGSLTLAECGGGVAAAGGAAPVANNDQAQWLERIMAKDKNADGRLTPEELTENEKQMLRDADQNGDGAIDRQELMAMENNRNLRGGAASGNLAGGAGPAGRRGGNEAMGRFFQYDVNRDGRLTADEVPPQAMAVLGGGDRNGDGAIDAGELQAIAARMGDRMKVLGAGVDPNVAAVRRPAIPIPASSSAHAKKTERRAANKKRPGKAIGGFAENRSGAFFQPTATPIAQPDSICQRLRAGAAANRRVVKADVAAATTLAALRQAVAAGLDHCRAGLIATRGAYAAAVLRVFALANANRQIDLAAGNTV